jgi:hypothetical protein
MVVVGVVSMKEMNSLQGEQAFIYSDIRQTTA